MISVNIYEADYQVIENISLRQNGIYSDKKILVTFCAFCSRNSLKHNYNIKTQYVENRRIFYIKIYLIRGQIYLMIIPSWFGKFLSSKIKVMVGVKNGGGGNVMLNKLGI